MSTVRIPDDITHEQVTAALVALGLDHLEADHENGLSLESVHLMPGGMEVTVIRYSGAIFQDEASRIRATVGHRREPR